MTDEEFAALQARADARYAITCKNCNELKKPHGDLLWPGPARYCRQYEPHGPGSERTTATA